MRHVRKSVKLGFGHLAEGCAQSVVSGQAGPGADHRDWFNIGVTPLTLGVRANA